MAYSVGRRTREMGVRMALGAEPRSVRSLVLGEGLRLTLVGVAVGLITAFGLARFLESLLFEVSSGDPLVFGTVALVLTGVGALACYWPARRASKMDPMTALTAD